MKQLLAVLFAFLCSFQAHAADSATPGYPTKTIRIIFPYAAGGSDFVARLVAARLSTVLGTTVIVESKPGASGNIGSSFVATSAPDGYTLLAATNGPLAINPYTYREMGFDPQKDLEPITVLATAPQLLVVKADSSIGSVKELVARAKAQPGKLNYGSVGRGSGSHLTMELLNKAAGIDVAHIPYNGAAPSLTSVIGGQTDMMIIFAGAAMPHVLGKRLKALAVTSASPSPLAPGVPPLALSYPDVVGLTWIALMAPAKTPKEIVARLQGEIAKIFADPSVKESLFKQGFEVGGQTPQATAAFIHGEAEKWGKVVKSIGMQPE